MVLYFLDFHENIRFSKKLSKYQEQPYPIEKAAIVFLDSQKKAFYIHRISMEQPGNIPIFNIPGTLFWNIPRNFIGNFFPNILGTSQGNVPRILNEHIFARWVTA